MNTTELAERVAAEHALGKGQAKKVVEAILAAIVQAASGEEVALGGFGKFKITDRPARQGRNPATGAAMEIAASRKLALTPAKSVRDRLNPMTGTAKTRSNR